MPEPSDPADGPGSAGGPDAGGPGGPALPPHDPAGLGLARSIARSIGARTGHRRRRRRERPVSGEPTVSGARPDDRDPTRLGEAFERLVDTKGWSTDIGIHTLLARWATLVGPVNADHSFPESFSDGILTVRAESTVWATSLRGIANQLVARLNDEIGQGTVQRVVVRGPEGPSWKRGPRSVRDGRGPRDTYG